MASTGSKSGSRLQFIDYPRGLIMAMRARVFFNIFGLAIMNWQALFPLGFLVLALFLFPNGVTGPGGIDKQRLIDFWSDLKKVLGITQEDTAS